jgi:hypothetical protein
LESETVSLIIGDNLKCENVEKIMLEFACWGDMELEVLINGKRAVYRAIALQPGECCYFNEEEGWRKCDPVCVFKYLLSHDLVKELKPILTEDVVVTLLSPHPILPPHGVIPITDAPKCLLGILINASRARGAINILQFRLTPLFTALATYYGIPIVPEQQYIDALLSAKVKNLGSLGILSIDMRKNYDACLRHLYKLCQEEGDEECLKHIQAVKMTSSV